ncbi:MAG: peptide MFS transporter [Pseudomonadales bacterium]|nr:peptide MFS transporter [Pseudomonadales bacterium]MDA0761082.1 peptide MFS transporter [Pseudomonadota bacterium]MDA0956577.1 peptide MFS transporter [Pseudomonadota bacterium]
MTSITATDTFLGHPKGLYVLFATEMWERFSYYGMRALLILYLTKHWLFADGEAAMIYGTYAALVYAVPVLGGMIADRYLGLRKAIVFGAVLLVVGHLGMAIEGPQAVQSADGVVRSSIHEQFFYLALAFIVVGVGFLKANISTIVGSLYQDNDPRRDGGFTIFYMGINLGAFVATLVCAYLGETYGWRYGFGLAGIGMLVGLVTFLWGTKYLEGHGLPPNAEQLKASRFGLTLETSIYTISVAFVLIIWLAIQNTGEMGLALTVFAGAITAYVIWFSMSSCTTQERNRMLTMLLLMAFSVVFWALFEQAGSSVTLFTDRNIDRGDFFTAGMFQSLNALFIILLAPVFASAWVVFARRRIEPSTPMKFGIAIVLAGLGFFALVLGALNANSAGQVAAIYLVLMYLLHTMGELCLSPVGLSMVTKLSVQRVAAMMMGVWFLSSALAAYVGGWIAGLMAIDTTSAGESGVESLAVYVSVFEKLGLFAVLTGIALMAVSPWIAKRMT